MNKKPIYAIHHDKKLHTKSNLQSSIFSLSDLLILKYQMYNNNFYFQDQNNGENQIKTSKTNTICLFLTFTF